MLNAAVSDTFAPSHRVRRVAERELALVHTPVEARALPARRPDPVEEPARAFWRDLVSGRLHVLETFALETYCCAVAAEPDATEPARALTERELVLLHRALQAETQKVLAAGFDLSVPAVSQLLGGALRKLGVRCRVGSTPLPLVLAGLRHCGAIALPLAELVRFDCEGARYTALALPALDPRVLPELSQAEREVARLTAIGLNPNRVAEHRGTAPCTVTNQLASLHKKLAVHGRFELIRAWARFQWGDPTTA